MALHFPSQPCGTQPQLKSTKQAMVFLSQVKLTEYILTTGHVAAFGPAEQINVT